MRAAARVMVIVTAIGGALLASASGYAGTDSNPIDRSEPVVATVGDLQFRECILEAESRDRTVECAWHQVPEDYRQPDGKQIELFVVRLPARKPKQSLEPMLLLAGGPGQAASQAYLHIDRSLSSLAKERDLYLVDQRGTGRSNFLGCGEDLSEQDFFLIQNQPERMTDFIQQCLKDLPGDPRLYTTSVALKDFENLRAATGISQWNLFGASYGTRVALHYMRRHPDAIRTAVLDSVVPPEQILGTDIALLSQKILSHLYQRCEQDPECHEQFPDLESDVTELFARLEDAPVQVPAENFRTGQVETLMFTRAHLVMLVRMYLYHTNSLALLPPVLHEAAANDNFAPVARAAHSTVEMMDDSLSLGMHNAVLCTEDAPFLDVDAALLEKHQNTYMGAKFLQQLPLLCGLWPEGVMDDDLKEPLVSDVPILLLSGEYDPITPPAYAEQVLQHLSNGRHLVLGGQGHFVSTSGCAPHLIAQFVDEANVDGLDASCLERLSEAPLFINFNGPSP